MKEKRNKSFVLNEFLKLMFMLLTTIHLLTKPLSVFNFFLYKLLQIVLIKCCS